MKNRINKKKIVKNTLFLYTKTIICMAIALFTTRIILRALGDVDFGIYGTVGGAIAMLESLNLAMTQATQRFMNYAEGEGNLSNLICIFNNSVILHLVIGVIIALFMIVMYIPLFNGGFTIPLERVDAAKYIYVFLLISTFFTIITVPYDAMINAHEDFLYYSIVNIIIAFLKLIAAIIIVNYVKDRLVLYGLLMSSISIINMIIMRVYCKKKYAECIFNPKKFCNYKIIKQIGTFAGWNFVGAFSNMAGNHGSTILMNHFFGPIFIAAKSIGDQICSQVSVLTSNMTKAMNPVIVKSEGGGDRDSMLNLTYLSCRLSFILYLILAIPFLFNIEYLLRTWLGTVPLWSVLFCKMQVIRTLFEQLFSPLRTCLIAQGTIKQINIVDLVLSFLTFFLLFILYSNSYNAVWHYYISILFLVFFSGLYKIWLCYKICNLNLTEYFFRVLKPSFICLFVSVPLSFYFSSLFLNPLYNIVIIFFSLIVIVLIGGFSKNEINSIIYFFKRNISN